MPPASHNHRQPSADADRIIKALRNAIMATASRFWWWQAGTDRTGAFLQNTNRRPRPARITYTDRETRRERTTYVPARPTRSRFREHVLNGRALFLTNRPESEVWHVVIDCDDADGSTAATIQAKLGGRAFISASRSTGRHLHLRLRRDSEEPEQTTDRLDTLADAIRRQYPQAEAIKGLPYISRQHGQLLDDGQIDELSKAVLRHAADAPTCLDDIFDTQRDHNASFLAPCLGRGTQAERIAKVEQYLAWHTSTTPITIGELENIFGTAKLPQFGMVQHFEVKPPAGAKVSTTPAMMKRITDDLAQDRRDAAKRATGGKGAGRLAMMLTSKSKPAAWLGAIYAAIQQIGVDDRHDAIVRAHDIYSTLPAATDAVLDKNRYRHLGRAFDIAVPTFKPDLASRNIGDPLRALREQATTPGFFTDEQIKAMARALPRQLAEHGITIAHNTMTGLAIAVLTIRKNRYQHDERMLPEKVQQYREGRGAIERPGAEISRKAVKNMLAFHGKASGGSAAAEAFKVIISLGGVAKVADHTRPSYDQHTGDKLADGLCECFVKGPDDATVFAAADALMARARQKMERAAERQPAGGAADLVTAMSLSQRYKDGTPHTNPLTAFAHSAAGLANQYNATAEAQFTTLLATFQQSAAF